MDHFVSRDGTPIAYERTGEGPPLALVHGTGIDHSYWDPIVPLFEPSFTVYRMDRRGRGQSGDAAPYVLQREFEDVAAFVESVPDRVFLLGHSYGALCSLEASLLTTRIRKMILNEPPMYTTVEVSYPANAPERFFSLLLAGETEKALLFLLEVGGTSAAELRRMRSLPSWRARIQALPTVPREILGVRSYSFDPARFGKMETPTLLMVGGGTSPVYRAAIEAVHSSLPNSRLLVLPGQEHDAMLTAPDLYGREVTGFFLERDRL